MKPEREAEMRENAERWAHQGWDLTISKALIEALDSMALYRKEVSQLDALSEKLLAELEHERAERIRIERARDGRDAEWNRSLRPSGMDDETWEKEGPKNPEQAVVFVAESERMGAEYVEELDRQHTECEEKRERAEAALRYLVECWEGMGGRVLGMPTLNQLMEDGRVVLGGDTATVGDGDEGDSAQS